jgi:hypothetical protein
MGNDKSKTYVGPSPIDGVGLFANQYIRPHDKIMEVFKDKKVINDGGYVNHQYNANTTILFEDGKWYLISTQPIKQFQEITGNYDDPRMPPWIKNVDQAIGSTVN